MTLDVVFLPLLGGYLFFSLFNGTRYRASSFPAQRLLFPSAAFGLIFLLVARALSEFAEWAADHAGVAMDRAIGIALPASAVLCIAGLATAAGAHLRQSSSQNLLDSIRTVDRLARFQGGALGLTSATVLLWAVATADMPSTFWALQFLLYSAITYALVFWLAITLKYYTRWPLPALVFRLSVAVQIIAAAIAALAAYPKVIPEWWAGFAAQVQNSGTPMVALVVAVCATALGNLVVPRLGASGFQYFTGRMNGLQELFFESLILNQLIQVNLSDRKVYIGWVKSLPPQSESADGFVSILPLYSGYRDKDTNELEITTSYGRVYAALGEGLKSEEELNERLEPFYKVIRMSNVAVAGAFDDEYFVRFNLGSKSGETEPDGERVDTSG